MQPSRLAVVLLALLLFAALALWWLGGAGVPPPQHALASPVRALPSATPVATVTPLRSPPGFRLAGVAVGEPDSFAVVESPNGTSALYRVDAEVPGLGRVVRIEAERVIVQAAAGQFDLWLAPAATPTATPVRSPTVHAPTARPAGARGGGTTPGSTPSGGPGRPAF